MAEPQLVADGVKAMRDAVSIPVTVKHRIGIDHTESYAFVRDFIGTVANAGCEVFIVHARNAWLKGLSPKENREVPPLRYETVYQLKRDFPKLTIVLNGGVKDNDQIAEHLAHVDGVMLGREAYHNPWVMADWDQRFFGAALSVLERAGIEARMVEYMARVVTAGEPWSHVSRHILGLWNGIPGARRWRQVWSDHRMKESAPADVSRQAALREPVN
jgi:tRNA-dihydrouridine synthase A